MLKIEMFEQPKEMTISEIINEIKKDHYCIEKFEFGDYDNWVTAIIRNFEISMQYTNQIKAGPNANKWSVCKKNTWVHLSDVTRDKIKPGQEVELSDALKENLFSKNNNHEGYSSGMILDHIEDLYDVTIDVIGVVKTN